VNGKPLQSNSTTAKVIRPDSEPHPAVPNCRDGKNSRGSGWDRDGSFYRVTLCCSCYATYNTAQTTKARLERGMSCVSRRSYSVVINWSTEI